MSEDFTWEKLKILLKLLKIKHKSVETMASLSKKIDVHVAQLTKLKWWLLDRSILIPQGTINIKCGNRSIGVEHFSLNHRAIHSIFFKFWDDTSMLYEAAHEYPFRDAIEDY